MTQRKILRAWKEIEVGATLIYRTAWRDYVYKVVEKDWASRSIEVRTVGHKRPQRPIRLMNVHRGLAEGRFRRTP